MFSGSRLQELNLSASPSWREYDEEFSKLLEDIPRATSAPPHLDHAGWALSQGASDAIAQEAKLAGIEHTDIRFDEDYARFYESYAGSRKLPPPVDGNTLLELPSLLQQHKLQPNGLHQQALLQQGQSISAAQYQLLNQLSADLQPDNGAGLSENMLQALQQLSVSSNSPNNAMQVAAAAAVAAGEAPACTLSHWQRRAHSARAHPFQTLLGSRSLAYEAGHRLCCS